MIILLRVISQRCLAQLAPRPCEIERMGEQMFRGDLLVDAVEMVVHGWVERGKIAGRLYEMPFYFCARISMPTPVRSGSAMKDCVRSVQVSENEQLKIFPLGSRRAFVHKTKELMKNCEPQR